MTHLLTAQKRIIQSFLLVAFLLVSFSVAEASSVIRTGETVSIAEDQFIEGDFYSAAGKLNISGEISQDALITAGQISLNGLVGEDVFLVGGTVDVYGTVGDDLRIIAGEITIAEPVMGDVLVIGGVVNILSTASIAGDLILLSGQTTVEGSVGGDILGRAEDLRIDGQVAGDVDVTVFTLTLGEKANIAGSVEYVSRNLVVQALNATVAGDLVRNDPVLPASDMDVRTAFIPMLVLLFSALAWFLIAKKSLIRVADRALIKSIRPFALGCIVLLVAPLAIVLLSVSMIGLFVGIAAFFGYGLLIVLSMIGISAVVGQLMMKLFNQPSVKLSIVTIVVGVVGVSLLMLLPIVGQIILLLFGVLTLGAIVDLLLRPKLQ